MWSPRGTDWPEGLELYNGLAGSHKLKPILSVPKVARCQLHIRANFLEIKRHMGPHNIELAQWSVDSVHLPSCCSKFASRFSIISMRQKLANLTTYSLLLFLVNFKIYCCWCRPKGCAKIEN